MSLINDKIVSKTGSTTTVPVFGIDSVGTYLLMDSINPDPINKISAKKLPEELVTVRGKQIPRGEWVNSNLTEDEKKMKGILFQGVWCSLCKEDQWGLASIRHLVLAGLPINYEFMNGNKLTITKANMEAFEAVWVPARNSFFQ